jgi:hypothetical protein
VLDRPLASNRSWLSRRQPVPIVSQRPPQRAPHLDGGARVAVGQLLVDGRGAYVEPISDRQRRVVRQLMRVCQVSVLGQVGYDLCRVALWQFD